MLTFKKAEPSDIALLAEALSEYSGRICDYSAGNIVFWRDYYDISYSLNGDGLVLRYGNMGERFCYSFPVSNEPEKLVKKLLEMGNGTVCLTNLTEEQLDTVKEKFDVTEILNSRDWDDYLYAADDIITLAGRRFSGQRNHINKFKKSYTDASFEIITEANTGEAKEFCHRYFGGIGKETASVATVEYKQLLEQFDNWSIYNQLGGMLKVDGTVIGLSVGEIVGDTLIVHTEKADTSFLGAYPMLTNSFAREFASNGTAKFINREEDCGKEGLRISKLSYHPIELIKKYAVTIKELS
ncbi:MAG: DUF2156 domain-containing protein [Clostridia bacterium]|nr:DUF2156 domain-containing protein [Clostridia bacterium]